MTFRWRHVSFIMILMGLYGIDNITASFLRDKPIYAPLDPHKWTSWILALCLMPAVAFMFWIYYRITLWRNNKFYRKENLFGHKLI